MTSGRRAIIVACAPPIAGCLAPLVLWCVLISDGPVPFDPASKRVFVRFKDAGGVLRDATSIEVRTLRTSP